MNLFRLFLLLGLLGLLSACDPEEPPLLPIIEAPQVGLFYDGNNVDAPLLQGGFVYEAGVRFPQAELGTAAGGTAESIFFYIKEVPLSFTIKLYSNSEENAPDSLLYSAVIGNRLEANSWHQHTLEREVILPDQDIWVAARFNHTTDQRTIGCDAGPAKQNGDWLFDNLDSEWVPLTERPGGLNINWNIRLAVQPN